MLDGLMLEGGRREASDVYVWVGYWVWDMDDGEGWVSQFVIVGWNVLELSSFKFKMLGEEIGP